MARELKLQSAVNKGDANPYEEVSKTCKELGGLDIGLQLIMLAKQCHSLTLSRRAKRVVDYAYNDGIYVARRLMRDKGDQMSNRDMRSIVAEILEYIEENEGVISTTGVSFPLYIEEETPTALVD